MDLDFTPLSDDQLVALIRAACAEAVKRGNACGSAARDAYMDEAERARIAVEAADREAERIRQEAASRVAREAAERVRRESDAKVAEDQAAKDARAWARRKGACEAVEHLIGEVCGFDTKKLNIVAWRKPGSTERRIFLQFKFDDTLVTYHVTGNLAKGWAPGKLECRKDKDLTANRAKIAELCVAIAAIWTEAKIDVAATLAWPGDSIPLAGYTPPASVTAATPAQDVTPSADTAAAS